MKLEIFLKQIKDNWVIVIFIAGLVISWTQNQTRLEDHAERILKLETQQEKTDATFVSIQVTLQEIKTKLEFIQREITK